MSFTLVRRVFHRGETQTQTTEVSTDLIRIGRGTSSDLHLDDLAVALYHATIEYSRGRYVVRDLTGVKATYVNHAPILEATVGNGDVIRIGPYALRLSLPSGLGALTILVEEAPDGKGEEKSALFSQYQLASGRWTKKALSITICLLILGGSALAFGLGKHRMFMPGGISLKHSQFADQCMNCHAPWKAVWTVVSDKNCQTCHAGPAHFGEHALSATPQCAGCHVEHKGHVYLSATPDSKCVQCHGDLKSKNASFPIVAQIHGFNIDHPEFAVSMVVPDKKAPQRVRLNDREELRDTATLKLNHKLHLDPELRGPDGREPLTCASCHRADEQGAYMRPISYEKDCRRCHLLDFDDRVAGKMVTHGKQPKMIWEELQEVYAVYYLRTHETEVKARGMVRRLPGAAKPKEEIFVEESISRAERFLYSTKNKKCLLCHIFDSPKNTAYETGFSRQEEAAFRLVAKTAVPTRWLPHNRFDHAPHFGLPQLKEKGCLACHEAASTSVKTSDVLLPGLASCQACHIEPSGAQADCISCHVYHDTSVSRPIQSPGSLDGNTQGPSLPAMIRDEQGRKGPL